MALGVDLLDAGEVAALDGLGARAAVASVVSAAHAKHNTVRSCADQNGPSALDREPNEIVRSASLGRR